MYCIRFDKYPLPKEKNEQEELAIQLGEDGYYLLSQLESPDIPQYLREISREWIILKLTKF